MVKPEQPSPRNRIAVVKAYLSGSLTVDQAADLLSAYDEPFPESFAEAEAMYQRLAAMHEAGAAPDLIFLDGRIPVSDPQQEEAMELLYQAIMRRRAGGAS